jgi:hypothetical protein
VNDAFYAHLARENNASWRARRIGKADELLAGLTVYQRGVVDDPCEYKAVVTPGQAGKTTLSGRLLLSTLLRRPQALIAYVSLTQKVAKRYLWEPLRQMNDEFGLELEPHNTDGYFRSPDGGTLIFGGIESEADVERYRGSPWDLFILDETKSADQRLVKVLVDEVLPPRLNNRRGTLALAGTPGAILHGKFWEVSDWKGGACSITEGPEGLRATSRPWWQRDLPKWQGVSFQWSLHRWSLEQNTARPDLWPLALALKRKKGWSDDNPIWLREFLGEWVADETNRLYRFNPQRNLWKPDPSSGERFGLPAGHDWYFVIGVDFGTSDPCCIETLAFSDTYPDLLQVAEFNVRGLSYGQQAAAIKRAQDACGDRLFATVGDPAKRGILMTLSRDYEVYVEAAEKREKRDAVELVSSDMFEGRIKLLEDKKYAEQAASLQWDETGLKEPSGVENDASDAGLYAHRKAQHRLAERPAAPPKPGTPEYEVLQDDAEMEAIARQERGWADLDGDDEDLGQVFDEGDDSEW